MTAACQEGPGFNHRGRRDPTPTESCRPDPATPSGNLAVQGTPLTGPRPRFGPDSQAKEVQELLDAHAMVPGDTLQAARQGLCLDRSVMRDHLMVLAIDLRGDSHMEPRCRTAS